MNLKNINYGLDLNKKGLIPGPNENEEAFFKRADYCLDLHNNITTLISSEIPEISDDISKTHEIVKEGSALTKSLYDIIPDWVPVFFSNYKLSFWQGGCAWIFQQKENLPTSAFFQLRQTFREKKIYLGLYDRTELVAHEQAHIGRMLFEEPKFEEILAYRSSKSHFRKFLGPLIQSSAESVMLVLLLLWVLFIDAINLVTNPEITTNLSFYSRLAVVGFLGYTFIRLCWRQYQFSCCFKNLCNALKNIKKAEAVIYRLTDKEIISFGKMSPDLIRAYAKDHHDFRWKIIDAAYFNKSSDQVHFEGFKFHNNPPTTYSVKKIFQWLLRRHKGKWPKHFNVIPSKPNSFEKDLKVTFVNHSTVLIQWNNLNILTDPIWSKNCNPFPFFGPWRVHEPGINFEDLPTIDLILLSHNHYDHLNLETLKKVRDKFHPTIVTGLMNLNYLYRNNIENVIELDWWQETSFKNDLEIIFVPSQHFSMRNPFNRNKTLWGGFVLKLKDEFIYFAGDTAYNTVFKEIHKRFGCPKLSLLPIGAFEPRWFMKENHMNPEDAVKAHLDLKSAKSIAIHHSTFQLADESFETPKEDLSRELDRQGIEREGFIILNPGESLAIK
jgi:L-ascorbate metabolism protein UlaG (beta-lactamase superfamily)